MLVFSLLAAAFLSCLLGTCVNGLFRNTGARTVASRTSITCTALNAWFGAAGGKKQQTVNAEETKRLLKQEMAKCHPNGLKATVSDKESITKLVELLEKVNPTKRPAYSPLMNGFWRMLYTDLEPAAASSGKLGPFVGDVFQDLDSTKGIIKNILSINFPIIKGALVAYQRIKDPQTWEVEFDRVGNSIFGIRTPVTKFPAGEQIRLWKITYLDDDFRILRAKRPETKVSFIFVLERDEKSRFPADY